MKKKHVRPGAGRINIREMGVTFAALTPEERSGLGTAAVPFTLRPLLPEDLDTVAQKGRTDMVRLMDRSGALKMTRTLDAEVRRVRSATPSL